MLGSEFLVFPHCTVLLSHFFWQKFREINGFIKEVTKELISQKKIAVVRENFAIFHATVLNKFTLTPFFGQKFRETNVFN